MLFIYYGCCSRRLRTINELLMMMMITVSRLVPSVLLRGQKKPKSVASPPSNEDGHKSRGPKVPRAPSMSYFLYWYTALKILSSATRPKWPQKGSCTVEKVNMLGHYLGAESDICDCLG